MQTTNQGRGYQVLVAQGAIPAYTITKPGTNKNVRAGRQTTAATAGTAPLDGAVQSAKDLADGDPANFCVPGQIGKVMCGDTLAKGTFITAGSGGKAVAATTGKYYIGYLADKGVLNEISDYVHSPGFLGAAS